ncbi:MAG: hypothetical protein Q8P49_04710 [Candidatus Liptonbacteria bacterium]|nr:hypothetical protein [Candidatus Liptonbacteria bacterium]
MSYKKTKLKKGKLSQLKYKLGLARIALWRFIPKVGKKEEKMLLPQTEIVMRQLRKQNRIVRPNNSKINRWVDDYINQSILMGKPVEILTQWCISKDLEARYQKQCSADSFVPTKKECLLFEREIPGVAKILTENVVRFNWWITFNRSYLATGRIDREIEALYVKMVTELASPLVKNGWLAMADWEDDILGRRILPDKTILASIEKLADPTALGIEIRRHSSWAREEAGLKQSDEELKKDAYFQIACEAEEARILCDGRSPFGQFVLIPLEVPERYDFFLLGDQDFKKRIVPVLSPYPWRL